jgi:hypothetical protein
MFGSGGYYLAAALMQPKRLILDLLPGLKDDIRLPKSAL